MIQMKLFFQIIPYCDILVSTDFTVLLSHHPELLTVCLQLICALLQHKSIHQAKQHKCFRYDGLMHKSQMLSIILKSNKNAVIKLFLDASPTLKQAANDLVSLY